MAAMDAELARLGLDLADSPYGVLGGDGPDAAARFLARLRALRAGATWRDVFPDMPAHWVPGRPETWTKPYRPYGPFDYPAPPAGPSLLVVWDGPAAAGPRHDALVQRAQEADWPVYGGGVVPERRPGGHDTYGYVVLRLGTSEEVLYDVWAWIQEQPGVLHSRPDRTGDEIWAT